jgi:membrane protease YdiL (CAAX protease family)
MTRFSFLSNGRATQRTGDLQRQRAKNLPAESNLPLRERHYLAPPWHTAVLIALILGVAALGTWLSGGPHDVTPLPASGSRITALYLPMITVQWGLAVYVCRIGRGESALGSLVGRTWHTIRGAAVDVAVAIACVGLVLALEHALGPPSAGRAAAVSALLPHTLAERGVWSAVALSAGVCEELVYRGYLQTQLRAFTGSAAAGVLVQGALFGIAHGEQGAGAAARAAVYGVVLGLLALSRKSLVPGMLTHVAIDFASAF